MLASKNNQTILLYIIIVVFSIAFLVYFYRQASVVSFDIEKIEVRRTSSRIIERGEKINLDLLKGEKFKKLNDIGVPVSKFEIGKRNPFEPY